jgi:pSer/pThr/pTyr-binding forkhead associated (FHA) protein/tetratricopeptide (TPR) repeat protein
MAKIVVKRTGSADLERALDQDRITIGREAGNDIVLADSSVSRRHARIEKTPSGSYRIVDLESGNGIVHQGKRVPSLELYPDCEVEVGSSTLTFVSDVPLPLLVLVGGGPQRTYSLSAPETFLGRSPDNSIAIPDPLVSSRHLKIVRRGELFAVVDLDSENGTRVNGVRVSSKDLQQGDQIQVGGFTLFFARDGVVPPPDTIQIIQPAHTPAAASARVEAPAPAPPAAPSPLHVPVAPRPPAAKAAKASSSRKPLLLAGVGLFALLFLLVIALLVRSPDKGAEREFQEVFQAELSAEEREHIEEYLKQAEEYDKAGNLQMALEEYRKILVLDGSHHQAKAEAARLEEAIAQDAAARAERERVEREKQAQVASLAEKAAALLGESKFDEARAALEEARALSPDSEFLSGKLAESYVAEGNYLKSRDPQRARTAYQKALELAPGNADAQRGLSGMEASRRASQEKDKRVETLTEQGLAQLKREEYRAAYASFSELLKLDPGNGRAREFRDQAAKLLEAEVRPMYDEGVRLYNEGQLAEAMAQFQKVLAVEPDHADTKAFLQKASEKVRSEAVDRYKRAYIYEGLGRFREALDLYRQCLELLPDPREEYHKKAAQRIDELSRKVQ